MRCRIEDGQKGRQDGQDEDDGQGAGVGQVAVDEDALGDLVADHLAARAADQVGDDVRAEGRDEDDQDGRQEAAPDAGQENLAEGLERPGAQIAGGLDQTEIELLRRGVDGQDGERQEGIDHDQDDRFGIIKEGGLGAGQPEGVQRVLDQALGMEKRFPGEDADEEACPEGHDDQHQQEPAALVRRPGPGRSRWARPAGRRRPSSGG